MKTRKGGNHSNQAYVPLPGSSHELLPESRAAGPIVPSEIASVTIRTRSTGDFSDLETQVLALYQQPLANRQYFTRDQLQQQFGAVAADFDAIERHAQKHSLVVSRRNSALRTITLTGRLCDLLNAFKANVQVFHHSTGTYRGRQGEIYVPRELDGIITAIIGFDTRPKHKVPHRGRFNSADGPGGANGVAATDFAKRYNFPTKQGNVALDGTGQCIGIIELGGGFNNSDLQIFFQEVGVPLPNVVAVSVDNTNNHPTLTGADDGEVMLDIEVAGDVAPGAKIAVYFAPNQGNGFFDAVNAAVHDAERNPSVLSISWGGPEDETDAQTMQAFHEVFVEAAALGITVCTAAGDHGTADLESSQWDGKIHVDHPSSDDFVLACGGTQIDPRGNDVVWNDGTPFSNDPQTGGGGWASGGGISKTNKVPAYQQNANLPVSIDTGQPGRGVPDVAMSATNYFTRVQGAEFANGGTSAVAPLMASLVALLNQGKQKNVGFLNPFLYAQSANGVVNDVTTGTNAIKNTIKGYEASSGWDACTGLGTPNGTAILSKL
jgi:kumamolisin